MAQAWWARRSDAKHIYLSGLTCLYGYGNYEKDYAVRDLLTLCLRDRSYSTKVQQSSLGAYYAIVQRAQERLCLHAFNKAALHLLPAASREKR